MNSKNRYGILFRVDTWCVACRLWACAACLCMATTYAAETQSTRIVHDEYLYMIRFSPDGQSVVTAAGDNVARVWSWPDQEAIHTFSHDAAVYAAVFTVDGQHVITGSGDGQISVWELSTGKRLQQKKEHADAVYCVDLSPDGKRLASIGGDGKRGDTECRVWSFPELKVAHVLPGHDRPGYATGFGPSRGPAQGIIATSGGDGLIHLYPSPDAERVTLKGHSSDVYRFCFSPDGRQLATTSQDRTVRVWDVETKQQVKILLQAKDPTYDVAFSADGRALAAVADDGVLRIWNTETYQLLQETKASPEGLYSVVFTPDQNHVLTGGVRGNVRMCPLPAQVAKRELLVPDSHATSKGPHEPK